MSETSKAFERRQKEGFFPKYIRNLVIDIGCGSDGSISDECEKWDVCLGHGDATFMKGVADNSFDTVYSSHLLEHLAEPAIALRHWYRITKEGGWLIVMVPHRDLYEKKRLLPSTWNQDHKHFFMPVWNEPPHTLGLMDTFKKALGTGFGFESLRVLSDGNTRREANLHPDGEYSIEMIVKKIR
jgi:SAM-dependent methyltransferase